VNPTVVAALALCDAVAREIIEMRDFSAEPSGKARRR
jgi:hypothetical protein